MELVFEAQSIDYLRPVFTKAAAQEQTQELIVPEALRADTKSCNEDNAMYYKVYQDNAYAFTFCVQEPVMTTEIYVYETMDAEEAVAKAKELRDSLY